MKISKMVLSELQYIREYANLTEEEEKVFLLLSKNKSIVEISEKLNISTATVSRRIAAIKVKINRIGGVIL